MSNMNVATAAQAVGGLYFCGEREFAIGGHSKMIFANLRGPDVYETGGVKLDSQLIGAGFKGKVVSVIPCLTDSGTYRILKKFVSLTEVRIVFTVVATGAEVGNGVNLSAELITGVPIIFIP